MEPYYLIYVRKPEYADTGYSCGICKKKIFYGWAWCNINFDAIHDLRCDPCRIKEQTVYDNAITAILTNKMYGL